MIKKRIADKTEVGKKWKNEGLQNSHKKGKFSKSDQINRKFGERSEIRWCKNCKVKHTGQCIEVVICYRCGKTGKVDPKGEQSVWPHRAS